MEKYDEIDSVLTSLWYNRHPRYVVEVIKELISRVTGEDIKWTDDGNIIYGMLVISYGDYGGSPRAGWIDEEDKGEILTLLCKELEDYERSLRLWEEDDERSNH